MIFSRIIPSKVFALILLFLILSSCNTNNKPEKGIRTFSAAQNQELTKEQSQERINNLRRAHNDSMWLSFKKDTFPIQLSENYDEPWKPGGLIFRGLNKNRFKAFVDNLPIDIPSNIRLVDNDDDINLAPDFHFNFSELAEKERKKILSNIKPYAGQSLEAVNYGFITMTGDVRNSDMYPPGKYGYMMYNIDLLSEKHGVKIAGVSFVKIFNDQGELIETITNNDFAFSYCTLTQNGKYLFGYGGGSYGEGGGFSIPELYQIYDVSTGKKIFETTKIAVGINGNLLTAGNDTTQYILNLERNNAYVINGYNKIYLPSLIWMEETQLKLADRNVPYKTFPVVTLSILK